MPAPPTSTTLSISSIPTTITHHAFTDKLLITITQDGRLAQWLTIPLTSSATESYLPSISDGSGNDDLLPDPHLTPRTLLGAATPERETTAQLLAVQIASMIRLRDPGERRALVLGLGLREEGMEREAWLTLLEGVGGCLLAS